MSEDLRSINSEEILMQQTEFRYREITPGLGYGEGGISGRKIAEKLTPDEIQAADQALNSPAILVDIDEDDNGNVIVDDGCGDGRGVELTHTINEVFKRSLNRAKVFGGGVVMGLASLIGAGKARGRTLEQASNDAIVQLEKNKIDFGAHTGHVEDGKSCGCGAIDKSPEITLAVVAYQRQIRETLPALNIDTQDQEITKDLDFIFGNYKDYADEIKDQSYSGGNVINIIGDKGKIIKQLAGGHKEYKTLFNTVRGKTVNQELIRKVTNDKAQIFAVDLWRIEDIAKAMNTDDTVAERRAVLSMVIHTLAVAAILTDGTLPTGILEPVSQDEPQLASQAA
jgi:hypothetical protein